MRSALAILLALLPVLASGAFAWRSRAARGVSKLWLAVVLVSAGVLAWVCQFAELGLWELTGLSLSAGPGMDSQALLAMFLFAAPLEEGAKVLVVWPYYSSRRRLIDVRHAIVLSGFAGAGFAAGKASAVVALGTGDGLDTLRAAACMLPHIAAAVLWGSTLGVRAKTSWFALAWLLATLLRGGFDHIVFGRGPGVMILGLPLLVTMAGLAYGFARRAAAKQAAQAPMSSSRMRRSQSSGLWSEPPSVQRMWLLLQPKQDPLLLHWICLGTLVTAGVGLCALAAALYAGHAMGLDFAAADEADVRSNGPLFFLATAVGSAFPIAGYLVARASGTRSVLTPALGAALAVLGGVVFLSVTTPIAAVFALALAPIAFVLASGGAWFGMSR